MVDKEESKIKIFLKDNDHIITFIKQFVLTIIIYGILLNFTLSSMGFVKFNWQNIISYGFVSYILKFELPIIIKSSFPINK